MLKNNNTKPSTGYDRIEFYIDFVQVLLSAFMLGYVIGKKKKKRMLKKHSAKICVIYENMV